jgi:uroporphyrinogen III methyltransferase / synthase
MPELTGYYGSRAGASVATSGILAGKRIVITRAAGQGEGLRTQLTKNFGAEVIELPCVEFRNVENSGALDSAIRSLGDYSWLLFTSQNAARFFGRRCRALGLEFTKLAVSRPRVAAIGPATAEAAEAEGFPVDFVPPAGTGRNFAGIFKGCVRSVAGLEVKDRVANFVQGAAGARILTPRSDVAMRDRGAEEWTEVLREAGAEVTEVVAYLTCMPQSLAGPQLERVRREGADYFVFASPSAFENFAKTVGVDGLRSFGASSAFAAIGPTTAAAIRAAGISCKIEAATPSAEAVAAAIAEYFSGSSRMPSSAARGEGVKHA